MTIRTLTTCVSKRLRPKQICTFYTFMRHKHTWISKQWSTKQTRQSKHHSSGYHIPGPAHSKSTRLAIAISPCVDDIWEHIQKCDKIDESVFWCAMKRCIQLQSIEDLSSFMDFLLDDECMSLSKMKGPTIHHWCLLFRGLYQLNDLHSALEWFNIMLSNDTKPNITIFNNLIALCCTHGDIARGIKLFECIKTFELEYDKFTYAEMIQLYSFTNEIEKAQQLLEEAKDAQVLCTMHHNYFLKGLSLQQRQDDDNKAKQGLERMLCFEFESELIEYLPHVMHDLYENMVQKDRISPDIKTFEYLLLILSFYGNSSLCLHYFKQATNVFDLRPTIHVFNSLMSCYCNEISLFAHQNESVSVSDVLYYEKHLELMDTNMDKIWQVYDNCKALLIAPNINTMKLLFHCMNARIMLSQSKTMDEEYTKEHNVELLRMLYEDDINNYEVKIDEELGYYVVHCWSMLDIEYAVNVYRTLYENKVMNHWRSDNELCLVNIPQRIYEDCWQFYVQYVIQYEMDKLSDLDELVIVIPSFERQRGIDIVQSEMEQVLDVKLMIRESNTDGDEICFVAKDCKAMFTESEVSLQNC
eukprot:68788_1